jgi:hypothetical protein
MKSSNGELWLSFFAILFITLVYIFVVISSGSVPAAGEFFGHSLGIAGFLLMLMTETLYTLRKRTRNARWGRMSFWLKFHIFTGLVGPYMVLLHSSWKFNGLAGIVMLLTLIIVASGFIGRYIYTAIPRTADGVEIASTELEQQIATSEMELQRWLDARVATVGSLPGHLIAVDRNKQSAFSAIFGHSFVEWRHRRQWRRQKRRMDATVRAQLTQLEKMTRQRRILRRQVASLAIARRLLSLWHAVHIPIGISLFTAAFVHVIAAIYYATLLR